MASLLKRGNKFYIRVYVNGKAKDIATETTNIKIAESCSEGGIRECHRPACHGHETPLA